MKGVLTPEDQLRVLGKIWGHDRDGYVFLPHIDGSARTVERRRKSYHEGRAYEWPREKAAILTHLRGHEGDDLYFTPGVFNAKRRTEQNIDAERCLWADLDPVDPAALAGLRPTIAWESSPGRYQAVWLMDRPRVGASWPSRENHRLSLHLGADPSGWDSTQLLRVPGRANHKPEHREGGVPGTLLWDNGPRYTWEDVSGIPEVGSVNAGDDVDFLDEELLSSVDRSALWAQKRLKVSKLCREYMSSRSTDGADRSDVLWQIERDLADAGCTVLEIVALVRPTVWNKYSGRQDELRRLKAEAAKAVSEREDAPLEAEDFVERPEAPKGFTSWWRQPVRRPTWLVDDIWVKGGCGFISGAPKSYKSWIALDLAVSVASGMPFLGMYRVSKAGRVLYLQEEDPLNRVRQRLAWVLEGRAPQLYPDGLLSVARTDVQGAAPRATRGSGLLPSVPVTWGPPAGELPLEPIVQSGFVASDPAAHTWLSEWVTMNEVDLVIVDTLGTTAGEVDTDRSGDLQTKMLRPLRTIARDTNTAICFVHHNRKASGDGKTRAGNEMLGSVALHAWSDCSIYARSREGGEIQLEGESKDGPEVSMRFRIPHVGENYSTGERTLWDPELIPVNAEPEGASAPKGQEPAGRPTRGAGALAAKLRGAGLKQGRAYPAERLGAFSDAELKRLVDSGLLEYQHRADTYTWVTT